MPEPRARNWWKISCIGCVGLPCLGLMFTFGFVKCQVSKEADKLAPELAKLKRMGIPTEPEELRPNPPVPDAQNAALLYRRISEENKKIGQLVTKRERDLISLNTGFAGDFAEYRAALKKYQTSFALIDQLPSRPRMDYKQDYSKGFPVEFEEFASVKNVAKMLTARSQFWIDSKQYDRALKDVETQFVIANHLSEEVTLIGALVSIAINAIADASLDRLLYAIQNNQTMLAKTEAMLVRRLKVPNIRRTFYGEMILGRVSVRTIDSWRFFDMMGGADPVEPTGMEKSWDRMTIGNPDVKRMFEARAVAMWRELFEKFPKDDLDWQGFQKAFKDVEKKINADQSLPNKINQVLFPVFDQAALAFAKLAATQRTALLSVKLLRARASGLPKNLSKYGTLAIDPMDGKPMRYLQRGKGFKVWSIGQDLIDQGGKRRVPGASGQDYDIVKGFDIGLPPPTVKPVGAPSSSSGFSTPTVPGAP